MSCDVTNGCPEVATRAPSSGTCSTSPPEPDRDRQRDLVSASATTDQNGAPIVSTGYKNGGARELPQHHRQHRAARAPTAGRDLPDAIIVDNQLVATPTVTTTSSPAASTPRNNGSEITGVTKAEASRIALEIQSGTLPVKFSPYSQQLVSATLGKDSLQNGVIAGRRRPGLRACSSCCSSMASSA